MKSSSLGLYAAIAWLITVVVAYGAGWWSLQDGLALVITSECPDADYWSWTIHTRYWLESGDFAHRQTSLNHRQTFVDDDGLLRIVVCTTDPGVPRPPAAPTRMGRT